MDGICGVPSTKEGRLDLIPCFARIYEIIRARYQNQYKYYIISLIFIELPNIFVKYHIMPYQMIDDYLGARQEVTDKSTSIERAITALGGALVTINYMTEIRS